MDRKLVVGITGATGYIAWYLRAYLKDIEQIEIRLANRDTFEYNTKLMNFVKSCDVIVHLAGVKYGEPDIVYQTNITITKQLIIALEQSFHSPHVIFASSYKQYDKDDKFGLSKKESSELLYKWSTKNAGKFSNLIIPNIFGEYLENSHDYVSKICDKVINNNKSQLEENTIISLVHVSKIVDVIYKTVKLMNFGDIEIRGREISIGFLIEKMNNFYQEYNDNIIPKFNDAFERALFNCLIAKSFLNNSSKNKNLQEEDYKEIEVVKSEDFGKCISFILDVGESINSKCNFRSLKRLSVLKGQAEVSLKKILSDEVINIELSRDKKSYLDIPTLFNHNIENIGDDELVLLAWSN